MEEFTLIGIVLFSLMYILCKFIMNSQDPFWKSLLLLPLNLVILAAVQITTLILQAKEPGLTGVISILNAMFIGLVVLIIPLVVLTFCYVVYKIITAVFDSRKKKDDEWSEGWQ